MLALLTSKAAELKRKSERLRKTPGNSPTSAFTWMSGELMESSRIIVAGIDITTWPIVEITVPAGPLGILLDGSISEAALLDDYAPVTREGTPGAIELSGKIPLGSVLVGMDKFDFMLQPIKGLAEIGAILREASHLQRQLRFQVPPRSHEKLETQDSDKSKLLIGSTSNSTSLLAGKEGSNLASERISSLWSSICAATSTSASQVALTEELSTAQPTPKLASPQVLLPPVLESRVISASFGQVVDKGLLDSKKQPFVPSASDEIVSVEAPSGALGLVFDCNILSYAMVSGFAPLPDGSRGALERDGRVPCGAVIVEINGEDVSHESLVEIRERLGRKSSEPRRLSFCLPPPMKPRVQPRSAISKILSPVAPVATTVTASSRRISAVSLERMNLAAKSLPKCLEDMELRRSLELKLVMSYDRNELKFKECWFVVHCNWMNRWALFVGKGGPEPGPITNHELLMPEFSSDKVPNRIVSVRPELEVMKDFRFVISMVWSLLAALHGTGEAPPIARLTLDINSEAPEDISEVLRDAKAQAEGLATNMREKCQTQVTQDTIDS